MSRMKHQSKKCHWRRSGKGGARFVNAPSKTLSPVLVISLVVSGIVGGCGRHKLGRPSPLSVSHAGSTQLKHFIDLAACVLFQNRVRNEPCLIYQGRKSDIVQMFLRSKYARDFWNISYIFTVSCILCCFFEPI